VAVSQADRVLDPLEPAPDVEDPEVPLPAAVEDVAAADDLRALAGDLRLDVLEHHEVRDGLPGIGALRASPRIDTLGCDPGFSASSSAVGVAPLV